MNYTNDELERICHINGNPTLAQAWGELADLEGQEDAAQEAYDDLAESKQTLVAEITGVLDEKFEDFVDKEAQAEAIRKIIVDNS